LKNGTPFIGKIVAETERYLSFESDGASINIFKKLIGSIDGVPYAKNSTISDPTVQKNKKNYASGSNKKEMNELLPGSLKRPSPMVTLPEDISVTDLIDSLSSLNWKTRSLSSRYLGVMGQWATSSVKPLYELLSDTTHRNIRTPSWLDSTEVNNLLRPSVEAARALANIGESGQSLLRQALKSSNPLVRRSAAFGIGESSAEFLSGLIPGVIKDNDAEVRATFIGSLSSKQYSGILIYFLNDEDPDVRCNAAFMLGKLRITEAVKPLIHVLSDRRASVRANVSQALGNIGDPSAVKALVNISNDQNVLVREKVIVALGALKDTASVVPLILALRDSVADIRVVATEALSKIRDPRSIPSLYSLLKDENLIVRQRAEDAIKKHTDPKILISALDDESIIVQENAEYILWLLTGKEYGNDKNKWSELFGTN
jgi:HEAT repeat protein